MTKMARGLAIAAATAAAAWASQASALPVQLAPHRAVYDLSLLDADDEVTDVSGRLVMEFSGSSCSGYTTKLRFVTETEDPDGQRQVTDSRSSTFEAADGKRLEFSNETYNDQTLAEESKGTAKRNGAEVAVSLIKPNSKKFDLAGGIVFPTEQMEKVLDTARSGAPFLNLDVYDGSEDGEKVFATGVVIGHPSTASDDVGDEKAIADAGFATMRHWPLTLSYFDKGKNGDDPPSYTMSFVVYENGVGRSLKIDYGDFALSGRLTELSMLPAAPCP